MINYTSPARGDILSTNANIFWEETSLIIEKVQSGDTLELDLRASRLVDSVGLNTIVKIVKKMNQANGSVRILISSTNLKRICTFTRLDQKAEIVGP